MQDSWLKIYSKNLHYYASLYNLYMYILNNVMSIIQVAAARQPPQYDKNFYLLLKIYQHTIISLLM